MKPRPCQRCRELADRCDCPRFIGDRNMECQRCRALEGQHLLDFTREDPDSLICPTLLGVDA
jgi:hypothetical protein